MTEDTKPGHPAFDPAVVSETNFTSYPGPHRAVNSTRYNRRLADHAGLKNFGVNLTRIIPGGQSSFRHAHSRQDEFIYVLQGEVVLETNDGEQVLRPGMCAGFPAGTGDAHRFVNRTASDVAMTERRATRSAIPMSTCMPCWHPTGCIGSAPNPASRFEWWRGPAL